MLLMISIVLTVSLMCGLLFLPDITLHFFWGVVVPLLPATFLVSTSIWRSVCPLAAFNKTGNRFNPTYSLSRSTVSRASAISILLFFLLVPARRFLFNENPEILAYTLAGLLALAFILGTQFKFRSGFCNSMCPVLPIEKVYGHSPLVKLESSRCSTCSLCTAKGCIDVAPEKSISKVLGNNINSKRWMREPLGIFMLSLPGFILGYFTTANGSFYQAPGIYAYITLCSLAAFLISCLAITVFNISFTKAQSIWACLSILCYYWFASIEMAAFLGLSTPHGIRIVFFLFIAFWSTRALYRTSRPRLAPSLHISPDRSR